MKPLLNCVSALALLCAACASAAAQRDECMVLYHWVEPGNRSMNPNLVGYTFLVVVADGEASKSFRHEESGLTVRVKVEYPDEPRLIRLSLALAGQDAGKDEGEYDTVAQTLRGKDWLTLSVMRTVAVGARRYTYTLNCTDEKRSWQTLMKKRAKRP